MTTQSCTFSGSLDVKPGLGQPSGQPTTLVAYDEKLYLARLLSTNISLDADPVQAVDMGTLTEANFLSIRTDGGKVRVRVTSTDGATQAIPVDSLLILRSDDVGITAVDLQRVAGVDTEVYVVLGQKA